MKIRMLMTRAGASDELGKVCKTWEAGWEGDILDSTARIFIDQGWAVAADAKPAPEPDQRAVAPPPVVKKPAVPRKRKPVQPNRKKKA